MEKASSTSSSRSRTYDASRRQADARARQERTAAEATRLFLERGYGATSIADIARAADVSPQFVYAAFESKAGVLARAVDIAIVGDADEVPVSERDEVRAAFTAPDVDERLARAARWLRRSHERAAPLIDLVESASASDEALARLAVTFEEQMRTDLARFVAALPLGARRKSLSVERAAEVLVPVCAARTWTTLVVRFGWTPDAYEAWLVDAIRRLVLA